MTITARPTALEMTVTAQVVADVHRVEMSGISWETYESLLADRGDERWPRYTYDRGWLEIVSPRTSHDEDNRILAHFVLLIAEEFDLELRDTGGFTYKGQALEAGFEPDSGFYLEREAEVRGKREIEGDADPPPDLVIEIDVTHSSASKLPLLARVGVNEVWRVRSGRVAILGKGADGSFQEIDQSSVLPRVSSVILNRFLSERRTLGWRAWVKAVRAWARGQASET